MGNRMSHGDRMLSATIRGFARLMGCDRGNVLAIVAAVMLPMLGLIGSGIDLSRTYLARNKLQQACDAGVLAGRKVYTTSLDANTIAEVRKYVNFDFPQGTQDTAAFAITPTASSDGAVSLALATTVPTSVMKIFGVNSLAISASCTGRQDFINTDVMMVLDTTLSMNCLPSEAASCYSTAEKSGSKIQGLRSAVSSFYSALSSAQTQLEAAGLRLRYGMVPYSMTVNTGKLIYAANPAWMQTNPLYQQCTTSGSPPSCSGPVSYNAVARDAAYYTGTGWGGCIEERATVNSITASSGYTIPTGANDLNIDTAPTTDVNTQWKPYDPATVTAKNGYPGVDSACPTASIRLQRYANAAAMTTDVNKLVAGGYTYHDIGLLWGARLLSQTGMWSSDNPASYAGFPVNRHLIFMTDGLMDPDLNAYSAYGVERYSTGGYRVTSNGDATRQYDSHLQRFRMLCNKVKSMKVSVWVVQFGVSAGALSQDMKDCASSPAQAFAAADSATLNAKFQQIGQSIGALRLSQ
jgi:Putative Flp pilus-assembly TadE/G-like